MFVISDGAWRKLTLPQPLSDTMREGMQNLGDMYSRLREMAANRPRAAQTKEALNEAAMKALAAAKALEGLDQYARGALFDLNCGSAAGPTARRDTWQRIDRQAQELRLLQNWCASAAKTIPDDPTGPTSKAETTRWLVLGFAHLYASSTGESFSDNPKCERLLGDFIELVDNSIGTNAVKDAMRLALRSPQT